MGDTCHAVISIDDEDDDDDDVEVVFTDIKKSSVYRNLICHKISQEIELLQAICKQTLPTNLSQFKEKAKNLGYGDDVINSAWERIAKKCLMKLNNGSSFTPNSSPPVCVVRALQVSVETSPLQELTPIASRLSSGTYTSSSNPCATSAVPVALLLNQCVGVENSPHQRISCGTPTVEPQKLTGMPECDSNLVLDNSLSPNTNNGTVELVVSTGQIRITHTDAEYIDEENVTFEQSKNKTNASEIRSYEQGFLENDVDFIDEEIVTFEQSKNKTNTHETCSYEPGFSKDDVDFSKDNVEEEVYGFHHSLGASSSNYFHIGLEQDRPCEKRKVSRRSSLKKKPLSVALANSTKKLGPQIPCTSPGEPCFINKGAINANNVTEFDNFMSALSDSYFQSEVPDHTQSIDLDNGSQKRHLQKRRSSNKKNETKDLSKNLVTKPPSTPLVAKSHVGVKAKIVRTKQTKCLTSKKRQSAKMKEISEEELKEFKAEQKRLKYEERQKLEMEQLQKVHDRLVDVLIPKYYNKS